MYTANCLKRAAIWSNNQYIAMLLPMAIAVCMMITTRNMMQEGEPEEPEADVPSETLPILTLENVALPASFRDNKKNRKQARHRIMDQLYDGTWRWGFPFSNHFRWFGCWLQNVLQTKKQRRTTASSGLHKVRPGPPRHISSHSIFKFV